MGGTTTYIFFFFKRTGATGVEKKKGQGWGAQLVLVGEKNLGLGF
jgi:hypothetical protein